MSRLKDVQHSVSRVSNVFESGLRHQLASRETPFHFDIKADSVRFINLFYWFRRKSPILYPLFLFQLGIVSSWLAIQRLLHLKLKSLTLYNPQVLLMILTIPLLPLFPLLVKQRMNQIHSAPRLRSLLRIPPVVMNLYLFIHPPKQLQCLYSTQRLFLLKIMSLRKPMRPINPLMIPLNLVIKRMNQLMKRKKLLMNQ